MTQTAAITVPCADHRGLFAHEALSFDPDYPYVEGVNGENTVLSADEVSVLTRQRDALVAQAKAICHTCPAIDACRSFSLKNDVYGVSGGITQHERDEINNISPKRRAAPAAVAASAAVKKTGRKVVTDRSVSRRNQASEMRTKADRIVNSSQTIYDAAQIPVFEVAAPEVILYKKTSGRIEEKAFIPPYKGPEIISMNDPLLDGVKILSPGGVSNLLARIYDTLLTGTSMNVDDIVDACADLIPDDVALHYWLDRSSQPTIDSNVRCIPGSMGKVSVSHRMSAGRRRCVLQLISRTARNQRTIERIDEDHYRFTKQAMHSWAQIRGKNVVEISRMTA